jgi:hypothetical protein
MSPEKSYSDREVALVLRRAAEIESTEGAGGGVAETDIVAIATEAGISQDAVRRALDELATDASVSGTSFLPPSSRRTSRAVDGRLDRDTLAALVQSIEDRAARPGTVTEALDTIRWTSRSSYSTMQVSLSSSGDSTQVAVHERLSARTKRLALIVPAQVLAMAGLIAAGSMGLSTGAMLSVLGSGAFLGFAAGREILRRVSAASRDRVERLASQLTETARRLGKSADAETEER